MAGEAVAVEGDARPDVVVMDIQMPGLDPFEACLRIVQRTKGRVHVMFWTSAVLHDEYLHRSIKSGASAREKLACKTDLQLVHMASLAGISAASHDPLGESQLALGEPASTLVVGLRRNT